jgi:hypothetical protein
LDKKRFVYLSLISQTSHSVLKKEKKKKLFVFAESVSNFWNRVSVIWRAAMAATVS